tara:strand:- start:304 stop:1293 length:990 start_codon:yes stop_codon:yes gene_type:complete
MGYRQHNNPFKRKTSSPLFSKSPLRNNHTDPDSEDFTITSDVTTGEDGNTTRVMERESVKFVDPSRSVENRATSDEAYFKSFAKEFARAQKEGFTGTLPEYIRQKEQKLGYTGSEEKVVEQRTITDTTTPTEQFEEFERPKTFFEDFRTEYDFPTYERGEDRRIKIDGNEGWTLYNQPVTGKSGNTYNKVNFNDERTRSWLKSEQGNNVLTGGKNMLKTIENAIAKEIVNADPNYPWTKTYLRTLINKRMDSYGLGSDRGYSSSDGRKYGMDTSSERWLNMFINNPDKLQGILNELKLTQEGSMVTDRRRIEGSESERTDTGWQTKTNE